VSGQKPEGTVEDKLGKKLVQELLHADRTVLKRTCLPSF
jgi:hypothetical protein